MDVEIRIPVDVISEGVDEEFKEAKELRLIGVEGEPNVRVEAPSRIFEVDPQELQRAMEMMFDVGG